MYRFFRRYAFVTLLLNTILLPIILAYMSNEQFRETTIAHLLARATPVFEDIAKLSTYPEERIRILAASGITDALGHDEVFETLFSAPGINLNRFIPIPVENRGTKKEKIAYLQKRHRILQNAINFGVFEEIDPPTGNSQEQEQQWTIYALEAKLIDLWLWQKSTLPEPEYKWNYRKEAQIRTERHVEIITPEKGKKPIRVTMTSTGVIKETLPFFTLSAHDPQDIVNRH